ncbi:MAG: hypothetical protein P8165_02665 [Deltaproteobacteria bacterium]
MTEYLFSFLFPFLLLTAALQRVSASLRLPSKGAGPTLVFALISVITVFIPVFELPLGRWLVSLNANFSIPLTALVFNRIIAFAFPVRPMDEAARHACARLTVLAGIGLYPLALGISRFDPYGAGWGFSWLFILVLLSTLILLIMKNRFGVVLLFTILAYNLNVLESSNFWDYLVDPVLFIWAATHWARFLFRKKRPFPTPS